MKKLFVLTLIVFLTLITFTSCSKKEAAEPAKTETAAPALKEPVNPASSAPVETAPAVPAAPETSEPSASEPEMTLDEILAETEITEKVAALNVAGCEIIAKVTKTAAELSYPSAITRDDINGFVAFVNANYAEYVRGVSYGFTGKNRVVVTYPESANVLGSVEYWAGLCQNAANEYLASLMPKAEEKDEGRTPAQQAALDATPAAPATPEEEKPVETKPASVTMISAQDAQTAIALSIPGMPISVHKTEQQEEAQKMAAEAIADEERKQNETEPAPEGYVPFRHHIINISADSNNFFSTTPFKIGVDAAYTYKFIPNLGVGGELGWSDGSGFHLLVKLNADALFSDFFGVSGGIGGGANFYTDNNSFGALVGAEGGFDFNISKLIGITLKTGIRYYFATPTKNAQFEWRPFKLGVKVSI